MRRTLFLSAVWAGLSGSALANLTSAQHDAVSNCLTDQHCLAAAKSSGNQAADCVLHLREIVANSGERSFSVDQLEPYLIALRGEVASTGCALAQLSSAILHDAEAGGQLAEIQDQYADVLAICDRLDDACAAPSVDRKFVSQSVNELQSSLSEARVLQQELTVTAGAGLDTGITSQGGLSGEDLSPILDSLGGR